MSGEEHAGQGVVKLEAVVALNCLDGGVELRAHIEKKLEMTPKVSDLRRNGNIQV
jgi:hypothetical protein